MVSAENTAVKWAREGLALARSGDISAARSAVAEAIALYPNSVDVQHVSGLVNVVCGDLDKALAHFHQALKIVPNFHFTEVEIALLHQLRKELPEARYWFEKAIGSKPTYIPAYVLMARFEREHGSAWTAFDLLESARKLEPANRDVMREIVDILVWHNQRGRAAQYLEEAFATGDLGPELKLTYTRLLAELAQYDKLIKILDQHDLSSNQLHASTVNMERGHARLAINFNRDLAVRAAEDRESSADWNPAKVVLKKLKQAIAAHRSFSLIRLGDGEGRILAYLDPMTRNLMSDREIQGIGESIWRNWFGASLTQVRLVELERLRHAFDESVKNADVVGIPNAQRIMNDNYHFGFLAYLIGYIESLARQNGAVFTDAFVNYELHQLTPHYREILEGLDFLGVISPHPHLGGQLAEKFKIERHVTYTIPGEMRLPAASALVRGVGHFPIRFNELMTEISVPRKGAVFLVAAGLLGKVYCARIKQLGGIAIDIGAVADAWSDFNTRPGQYDERGGWALANQALQKT